MSTRLLSIQMAILDRSFQVLNSSTDGCLGLTFDKLLGKNVLGYLVYTKTQEIVPVKDEAQLSMF